MTYSVIVPKTAFKDLNAKQNIEKKMNKSAHVGSKNFFVIFDKKNHRTWDCFTPGGKIGVSEVTSDHTLMLSRRTDYEKTSKFIKNGGCTAHIVTTKKFFYLFSLFGGNFIFFNSAVSGIQNFWRKNFFRSPLNPFARGRAGHILGNRRWRA